MGLMDKFKKALGIDDEAPGTPATTADASPASEPRTAAVSLTKGGSVSLSKIADVFTIIATWGRKDYDVYALVEYIDGHVEVVSCFGTVSNRPGFTMATKDGAVVHISGDQATSDTGGDDLPQEVIRVALNPSIKTVVPVIYSAKNSGPGSFYEYRVSTYVIEGNYQTVPHTAPQMVKVEAINANTDSNVYTFVPAVIHNGPKGPVLEGVELYSEPHSERRPIVRDGKVTMNVGEENAEKPRPNS